MAVFCWVVVISWLTLTLLSNLPRVGPFIRRFDSAGLLPRWTFFAPNPGVTDTILLVRERNADGDWSDWRVAWRCVSNRLRFIWHPEKRVEKLVSDCSQGILRTAEYGDETLGTSYLVMANMAQEFVDHWSATAFQFSILAVPRWWDGNRASRVVYRSAPIGTIQDRGSRPRGN